MEHPDEYEDLQDDEGEEEYDFDKKNLQVLQLHVKLRGFRCSADVLVREDCTFEDLHDFLNPLFNREDDHLYRFECEDGCTAVRDEEDIDDDEVLSSECYVGHHLFPGSGAYYLFDFGDEWELHGVIFTVLECGGSGKQRIEPGSGKFESFWIEFMAAGKGFPEQFSIGLAVTVDE